MYTILASIHKVTEFQKMHHFSVCVYLICIIDIYVYIYRDLYVYIYIVCMILWIIYGMWVQTLSDMCTYTVIRFHPPTHAKTPHSLDRDLGKTRSIRSCFLWSMMESPKMKGCFFRLEKHVVTARWLPNENFLDFHSDRDMGWFLAVWISHQ